MQIPTRRPEQYNAIISETTHNEGTSSSFAMLLEPSAKRAFDMQKRTRGGGYTQIVTDYIKKLNAKYTNGMTRFHTDAQGAYSLTPLDIAEQRNGAQLAACGIDAMSTHVIIDATAGVGGDAVSFMLGFPKSTVYALEPDAHRVRMLEHNVLAVRKSTRVPTAETQCMQAEFADLFGRLVHLLRACTVLYLDPEWGGPAYHNKAQVHLSLKSHTNTLQSDTDLVACVAHALAAAPQLRAVVLKLPTNVSSVQWEGLHALPGVRARVFDEWLHGHVGFRTLVLVRDT